MGQQQLLLIVLGVIIVGIAIVLGIVLFRTNAVENKRDVVINEAQNIATIGIQYYKKARLYGGGQSSYLDWDIPANLKKTENGTYTLNIIDSDHIEITGTGNEAVTGTDSVKVKTVVSGTTIVTQIIN